jgi:hypothetical protein
MPPSNDYRKEMDIVRLMCPTATPRAVVKMARIRASGMYITEAERIGPRRYRISGRVSQWQGGGDFTTTIYI